MSINVHFFSGDCEDCAAHFPDGGLRISSRVSWNCLGPAVLGDLFFDFPSGPRITFCGAYPKGKLSGITHSFNSQRFPM
jgi:hypothetical protein